LKHYATEKETSVTALLDKAVKEILEKAREEAKEKAKK
jgi:phosphoribosyl-ATP pyrophosphohydrolase